MSLGIHQYKAYWDTDGVESAWICALDGSDIWGYTTDYMDFSSGTWLVAQGETNSLFSQIGKMSPSKLSFSELKYLVRGSCWCVFNVGLGGTIDTQHYGRDEPASGEFRNWTL